MPDPEPFLALITPVDPSNAPDQGLPGQPPGVWDPPSHPDTGLPDTDPPVGLWPPLPPDLPTQLPSIGWKPGTIWPPLKPAKPDNTLPVEPPEVDNTLPGTPDQSLPEAPPTVGGGPVEPPPTVGGGPVEPPPTVGGGPVMPSTTLVLLAWVPGSGFRWVVVDTSLKPDTGGPSAPTPEPK